MQQDRVPIYSGASPDQVRVDLEPLVDFQEEGVPLDALYEQISERLVPHLMRYDQPQFLSMFNAFPEEGAEFGAKIAFDKMAAAFETAGNEHTVGPVLKRLEEIFDFQPACARRADNTDIRRILNSHRARQVRRRIRTVVTAESQYFRFKLFGIHNLILLFRIIDLS